MLKGFETHKTELVALLGSGKKEKTILKALLKALKADPNLIQKEYVFKRNLFHMIVLTDLVFVMRGMLDSPHKPLAFQPDRRNETVFHYAVRKFENSTEMLELLLKELPALIDVPNEQGKTALHQAVESGKLLAIKKLVSRNADPDRKDKSGKTPKDYAVDQPELIKALISINLDNVHFTKKFPSLEREKVPQDVVNQLTRRFSVLSLSSNNDDGRDNISYSSSGSARTSSEETHTPSSSKTLDKNEDFPSPIIFSSQSDNLKNTVDAIDLTLEDLKNGHVNKLRQYLISGGDPDRTIFVKRPLIIQTFILAAQSEDIEKKIALKEQFYLLLEYGVLESKSSKINFKALVLDRPGCLAVLQEGMSRLSLHLRRQVLAHQDRLSIYSEYLDRILYQNGLGRRVPDIFRALNYHELSETYKIKKEMVEIFDLLCACKTDKKAERVFDKRLISTTTLGIFNTLNPVEILDYLIKLFLHFDVQQRLTACMVVKELMRHDVLNSVVYSEEFISIMKEFSNVVRDNLSDGNEISKVLLQFLDAKKNIVHPRMANNYRCLQECVSMGNFSEDLISVQTIIQNAMMSVGAEQEEWVNLFADEIKSMTIQFYQNLKVSEFYNLSWKKPQSDETYSSINDEIKLYNMLSNFIVDEIMAYPPIAIPGVLDFFIRVAKRLCIPTDVGPDMNGLSKVIGALSKNPISRMASMIEKLSPDIREKLSQLSTLSGAESNYKWQREIVRDFQTTIMFIGMITKDVVMCFEGNENDPLALAQTLGGVFRGVLDLQLQLRYKPIRFKTNLMQHLLEHYANVDEDEIATKQYAASYRAVPPTSEKPLELDSIDSVEKLFNHLSEFTKSEMIPHIIYFQAKSFTIGSMIKPLFQVFTDLNMKEQCVITQRGNAKKMQLYLEKIVVLSKEKYFISQNPLIFAGLYSKHKLQFTHPNDNLKLASGRKARLRFK